MTIILYDIPSTFPGTAWSPNVWKTRYCLNHKGLDYKTEWVEYPDIEEHHKKLGIPPSSKKPDGRDHYTVPAIHDTTTGAYLSDSFAIAQYLDKQYPNLPLIFPNNTVGLQSLILQLGPTCIGPMFKLIVALHYPYLNPASQEYFRVTRTKMFGIESGNLEDITPKGEAKTTQWAVFREGMKKLNGMYELSGGPYVLGDAPSWVDFYVGGLMKWAHIVFGEESREWKEIGEWDGGRWKGLVGRFESVIRI